MAAVRPSVLAILAVLLVLGGRGFAAAPKAVCDSTSALTLIGIDTTSGRMLFSLPALGGGQPWIVELDAEGREARLFPDRSTGRFGGSVGPGPVIAASPCGTGCLQPVRWSRGTWEPLGEPLSIPSTTTITPTYDATGAAWFLVHAPGGQNGSVKAWGFRLQNREWKTMGSMTVSAVGQPPALPAPQRKDGVLTGTGLFSASGRPETWVTGVPSLPPDRRGQLVALTGTRAAYVSADGVVYLSDDRGKGWRRSTWTPWGTSSQGTPDSTVGIWRQGSDYWVDLPYGDHQGALRLAWFDRRRPSEEVLVLTRLTQEGDWVRLGEARSDVRTKNESLPVTQVVVPKGDTWVLLSGCAATKDGSGLVLRIFDGANLSSPRLVPFQPGR